MRDDSHSAAAAAVISRSIGVFAVALCAQGIGDILDELPRLAAWWNILFGGGAVLTLVWTAAAAVRGRVERRALLGFAAAVALGLLTWPAGHPDAEPGPPWLWHVLSLGTACLAGAAGLTAAGAYAVATSVLFAVVRRSPAGGAASVAVSVEDGAYAAMVGIAVAVAIQAIRVGAHRADAAEASAVEAYRESAAARAQLIERNRLGAILHDSVMTALISAARAFTPEQRAGAARAAREGIRQLGEYAATEPERSPVPVGELPARLQAVAENTDFVPVDIFSTLPTDGALSLPARAADALLEAVYTALDNASRHSGASRATVTARLVDDRLCVDVADGGRGFEPASVPQRRLGIRLSIIQRAEDAGGAASVESAPGRGTTVHLEWKVG
ncbi:sensor histidine kinase [Sinomonas notoginsengisoli]|uniref:sensor histidine kinase n=1 Tax=Sinomonas notoginsengisoli TaxID=1457311 RepID=UPI0027DF4665|nr:ATP-binding protein [Sinomonas notoginsengisoli]